MLGQDHGFEWVRHNVKKCPINNSIDLIGNKFAALVLRNMIVYKQTRFNQFLNSIEGINPKTLTARLRELEKSGLIGRKVYAEVPPRVEYFLTEKGMALKPVLQELARFSITHYAGDVFMKSD